MFPHPDNVIRQLWETPPATTGEPHCTPFMLPSNGVISFDGTSITLTTNVIFQPECTGSAPQDVSTIADLKDPFYASTIPQVYVVAATTVIAWILVIMLIITPRTSFLGQSSATPGFANSRGLIGGATGGQTSLIGVGSRPWLQRVAAFTVAVSLTIATADTFKVARAQYFLGYMDAEKMAQDVLASLEIRITRVISDIFLWLAQVQTLIRLFPRHREKVLIKWIGFVLILFDTLFSSLHHFMVRTAHRPRQFVDAIPALSYLFELALALLYAAWVLYYAVTKRRYAFYHQKMRSITLIAFLSVVAVLTPVVFFVTDVSNQDIARWGDYFRWVGAAAASVVVWEWVERIEALERDEKKDGILGREIFDGDEMLDSTPSDEIVWTRSKSGRNRFRRDDKGGDDDKGNQSSALEQGLGGMVQKFRRRHKKPHDHFPLGGAHSNFTNATSDPMANSTGNEKPNAISFGNLPKPSDHDGGQVIGGPTPPPPVVSPVNRADTTSAASTVYVVQHNPIADVAQPVRRRPDANGNTDEALAQARRQGMATDLEKEEVSEQPQPNRSRGQGMWHNVPNPFKRKRASPPAEVQQARRAAADHAARTATPSHNFSRWDVKNRLGVLAAETGERFREQSARRREDVDFPITVIPAQPRGSGRTWTPPAPTGQADVHHAGGAESNQSSPEHHSSGSTTLTANSLPPPILDHGSNADGAVSSGGLHSPDGASTTASPRPGLLPPRADDIRPVNGSASPTVIPAPRRSNRNSPLSTRHDPPGSPNGDQDDRGLENG